MTAPDARADDAHGNALAVGTRLGEFELRRVIGVGGFGIVYLAFDHGLQREVAIKEYMPSALASRTSTLHVSSTAPSNLETFTLGLKSFVNEARLLARFDHPSLIKVLRFWEEQGTAYTVMPLHRGRTLRAVRQGLTGVPDEAWLRRLLDDLLGALDLLHEHDVFHRDIAPDNILMADDGVPMLLDFGAARHVLSGQSQVLTAILKPSYAPIEQYGESASLRQGPWTDLYALGATLHFLITQSPPAPATTRIVGDDSALLAGFAHATLSTGFLDVIEWMLAPRPADRPQSVADLREVLAGLRDVPTRVDRPLPTAWQRTAPHAVFAPVDSAAGVDFDLTVLQPRDTVAGEWSAEAGEAAQAERASSAERTAVFGGMPVPAQATAPQAARERPPKPRDPVPSAHPTTVATPALPAGRVGAATGLRWGLGGMAALALAAGLWWLMARPVPAVTEPAAKPAASATPKDATAAVALAPPPGAEPSAASVLPAAEPAAQRAAAPAPAAKAAASAQASVGAASAAARPVVAAAAGSAAAPARAQADRRATGAPTGTAPTGTATAPRQWVGEPVSAASVAAAGEAATSAPRAAPARGIEPAPGSAPAASRDPREQCGNRMFLALHNCLLRECLKPEYRAHDKCELTRDIEARAKNRVE